MRTVAKCLALASLAHVAAAFAPSAAVPLRKASPAVAAACPARPLQTAVRRARAGPLRAAGLQMAVTNIPITVTGTNIEVRPIRLCAAMTWRRREDFRASCRTRSHPWDS